MPDARLAAADASRAPFHAQFDGIVAFDVLEHVPALDEAARYVVESLRPDGVFVFVVPVYDGPLGPVIRLLDRDPTHVHKRSRQWWMEWASRSFEVVSWTGILRYLVLPSYYLHVPSRAIRNFAPAIAVVAKPRR
jgi:SAM-dependent methyltransferase